MRYVRSKFQLIFFLHVHDNLELVIKVNDLTDLTGLTITFAYYGLMVKTNLYI